MKIRRFFAKDMRTALKQIHQEMGADAAILSTNTIAGGIEIVAATDYEEALRVSKQAAFSTATLAKENSPESNAVYKNTPNYSKDVVAKKTRLGQTAPISESSKVFFDKQAQLKQTSAKTAQKSTISSSNNMEWGSDPVISKVHDELKLLRGLMESQLAESSWEEHQRKQPIQAEIIKRLVNIGLPVQLSEKYALTDENSEMGDAWYRAAASLAGDIPLASENIIDEGGCYALVGTTGVGKTTTVAKLTAIAVKKYGAQSVALISTDSYRIAAHEQLNIYAQIMAVEMVSVSDKVQLDNALRSFSDKKLILIDTAGIGLHDQRLTEQLHCLDATTHKINHLLLLSATAQLSSLQQCVKKFGQFRLQGTILTKLDEATSLGNKRPRA